MDLEQQVQIAGLEQSSQMATSQEYVLIVPMPLNL
jgi:hypothetical protein